MKIYKVVTPVKLVQGLILLTDDQAKARLHCLRKTSKKGVFEIMQEVTFKAGEIIGLEQISKAHKQSLSTVEK